MILDVACGGRIMYHGLDRGLSELAVFVDIRHGIFRYRHSKFPKETIVRPDVCADMQHLPFKEATFNLVIFDPPHDKYGQTSYMHKRYGSMSTPEYMSLLVQINDEFANVLESGGLLLAKVIDQREKITKEKLTNFLPVLEVRHPSLSHRSKHKTHWILFGKKMELLEMQG